jgi:UDP-N-acetylmuramyl tripeptide synthase
LTGRNGSAIPGYIADRIAPGIASRLAADIEAICLVSGTNGKTSTAHYLAGIVEAQGRGVIANRSGANLSQAVASALIAESSITGGIAPRSRSAVLEVDEAALPAVAAALPVSAIVFTNIFRDQLDRFGETDHIIRLWTGMLGQLRQDAVVAWCADDPRQRALVGDRARSLSFGLEPPMDGSGSNRALDATPCPVCGGPLTVAWSMVGHLGSYSCGACGFARPVPWLTVESSERTFRAQTLLFRWRRSVDGRFGAGEALVRVQLPSLANAYNAAAAVTGAAAIGIDPSKSATALASMSVPFGRFEQVTIDGRNVILMLIKNPASFGEVARLIGEASPTDVTSLLFVLSDDHQDGRDVRCKYALAVEPGGPMPGFLGLATTPAEGLARTVAATPVGGTCVVVSTYTALMELRASLARRHLIAAMPR